MSIAKETLSILEPKMAFNNTAISTDTDTTSSIIIDIINYRSVKFSVYSTAYVAGDVTPFVEISNDITFASDVTRLTDADFNVLQDASPVKNESGFASAKLDGADQLKRFGIQPINKRYIRLGFTSANSANLSVLGSLEGELQGVK